jgi:D-serine deaminase-like pyridoxal phosphate-dependent protein
MGYEGHLVQIRDPEERRDRVLEALILLKETRDLLERNGLPVEIISGGGTGTYDVSGSNPPMTEIEAGSYVFMDSTYSKIRPEFRQALFVLSTVVSRPTPERLVTDAGRKTLSNDFGNPVPIGVLGASLIKLSEEHGVLTLDRPSIIALRPGDKMRFVPSHCCTTTNLYDRLYVIQNEALVDIWPISARGRAQ